MSGFNSDDRVMATAHHILSSLDSDSPSDMLRILSSLDGLLGGSASSSPRRHNHNHHHHHHSTDSTRSSSNLGLGLSLSVAEAAMDMDISKISAKLQKAVKILRVWGIDSMSEPVCNDLHKSFIWIDNRDQICPFLDAVDSIQDLIDNPPADATVSLLDHAQNLRQIAMLRLEEELRNLMENRTLAAAASQSWLCKDEDSSGSAGSVDQFLLLQQNVSLLPHQTVSDICSIATRMITAGYEAECSQVFVDSRRAYLEESLQRLGFERLTIEEVQRMPWPALENEISKWIRILKIAVIVIFRGEKNLCDTVFGTTEQVLDPSFVEFARAPMMHLLDFAGAVAISRRAPEKLFKMLDMYVALRDLRPSIESLFDGATCEGLRSEASAILDRLADAIRGNILEFENGVQQEASKNLVPGGAVHPLTCHVMSFVGLFSDHSETLTQLLKERKGLSNKFQDSDKDQLSAMILRVMELLEINLDGKSKLYKDPALRSLFLMNNLHYIVQKSKVPEVRKLIGDEWIKRRSGKLHQYHNDYRRAAWINVLCCLKDEGIQISGGSASSASKSMLKERFKSFNALFEENVRTQSTWVVSDPQLCTELQISITEMILPAYRSFLGRFQNYLDARHPEKYVKYTPEEVEGHLNELFEGSSGSSRRRSVTS